MRIETNILRAAFLYGVVFVLVALLYGTGQLGFVDRKVDNALFALAQRDATGTVVFVDIDSASLEEIGTWPWPRRLHAQVLDRLLENGASQVVFNVDFSARSNPVDDRLFGEALERAGHAVVLPVFAQPYDPGDTDGLSYIEPLPQFMRHAGLASGNVYPAEDGLLRRDSTVALWVGSHIWTLAANLSGNASDAPKDFAVDFGIRPDTIPRVSYIDVLDGRVPASALAGRRVIVGSSAIELGDHVPVPHWGYLPGPLFHALGAESILQGRTLEHIDPATILLALAATVLLLGPAARRVSWQRGGVLLGLVIVGTLAIAATTYALFGILFDATPLMLAAALSLASNHVLQLDEQKLRLLAQTFTIRRQDRFMRQVVDNVFDALITIDQTGTITSYNPAAERVFGHRAENIIGRAVMELFPDGDANGSATGASLETLLAVKAPREMFGQKSDGKVFAVEIAVSEINDDAGTSYVMLARDVSARKAAERAALEAQRRLLEAIESISEGFALYDADDKLVLNNSRYDELHGNARTLLIPGTPYVEIVRGAAHAGVFADAADEQSAWIEAHMKRHAAPGHPFEVKLRGERWSRITEYRTADGGIVQIVTDVTEDRRRETALQAAKDEADIANRSKSMFLANMSHELRTPLNAIIGFSDMMRNQIAGPMGQHRYLEYSGDVFASAQHLLGIINDILDISRVEAGKITLDEERIRLQEAIVAGLKLVKGRAEDGRVRIMHAMSAGLPDLMGDDRLIKQILSNLLSNAIRFTPAEGSVVVKAFQRPDGGLSLSVEDSGIGIAPEDLNRILRPFEQAENDHTRRFDGTGLGLPLVRHFMELHGGTLELTSQVDQGTTATVHFPPERTVTSTNSQTG